MPIVIALILAVITPNVTAAENSGGFIMHDLDVRIGHEPIPTLIKTDECFYEAMASSKSLEKVTLTPTGKICESNRKAVKLPPIEISTRVITNTISGERINTVIAGSPISISLKTTKKI